MAPTAEAWVHGVIFTAVSRSGEGLRGEAPGEEVGFLARTLLRAGRCCQLPLLLPLLLGGTRAGGEEASKLPQSNLSSLPGVSIRTATSGTGTAGTISLHHLQGGDPGNWAAKGETT